MPPNVYTIAAGEPFAETLARGLIAQLGAAHDPLALAEATIFLPTRRAGRTLAETFARILGGAALLPQLQPLGDIDEDEFFFDPSGEDLSLPPAITPIRRRLLLATLVGRWDRAKHGGEGRWALAQAAELARALARFLDEAATQDADLSKLETLAPASLADHWAEVREFLVFLREEWPKLLAAERALDPATRRNRLLDMAARRYATTPPRGPVIAAGTTGSIPATARLLAVIASLPNGAVILPGLDRDLDEESWQALDAGHPQFGLKELLARLGVERADVRDWRDGVTPGARNRLLSETLRPAPTTDAWRALVERGGTPIADGLEGLSVIEAAHPGEEALAIALILREALETPKCTAALVTPDRNLARRVAAELGRWDIAIDDSAGRPLAHTPPGAFLLLLVEAITHGLAPVPLLALLKHPLAAGGRDAAEFRRLARKLDRLCLRGPRPDPGLDGIRAAITRVTDGDVRDVADWFENIAERLAPLCAACDADEIELSAMAKLHAEAAEALAESDREPGMSRLWRGEAGAMASDLFAALQTDAGGMPAIAPASYAPLIRILMEEKAVRPPYGRHPRLAILGPLEARLLNFDVLVLGGLNEGTWPAATAADPWLSRPMRKTLGLPSPERAIGLAAHDFATLAASPRVHLTRALKADGAPTVASRWLQRLEQLTRGAGLRDRLDSAKPYAAFAARLELPKAYRPESRPAPTPPVSVRPRDLSVTEIEKWLRDPYGIYAKHVLELTPLDPLDAGIGPLERGTAIHRVLEIFLEDGAPVSEERLVAIADSVFAEMRLPLSTLALWRPRLLKAAHWFVDFERTHRSRIARSFVETRGRMRIPAPGGDFTLRARADRIDALKAGGAAIIDYKTGNPPTTKQVKQLLAPQLPLEGAILAAGGFADIGVMTASELTYIQFGGGAEAGKIVEIGGAEALVRDAEQRLADRIIAFDREETPYLPRVMPFRKDIAGEYDHLSRVREWSVSGWQEDAE